VKIPCEECITQAICLTKHSIDNCIILASWIKVTNILEVNSITTHHEAGILSYSPKTNKDIQVDTCNSAMGFFKLIPFNYKHNHNTSKSITLKEFIEEMKKAQS
jgi:hypothetical protein